MKKDKTNQARGRRSAGEWADDIVARLSPYVGGTCDRYFDSFDYMTTGNNLTHPLMLGKLAHVLWAMAEVDAVGIDFRFNRGGGIKFQPDLVAFNNSKEPLLALDYESPNSSDARVPIKDIEVYGRWCKGLSDPPPYVIITTLPDGASPEWQIRYRSPGQCNHEFRAHIPEIRRNPFKFWYAHYRRAVRDCDIRGVAMVNVNGRRIKRERLA